MTASRTMFTLRSAKPLLLHHCRRRFTVSSITRTTSGNNEKRPEKTYQWMDGVESLEQYKPGGYYPANLADEMHNQRYCILHKLGFGSFSTVWLAHDQDEDRLVSLKLLRADYSRAAAESKILQHLGTSHPGNPFFPSLLDEFVIESVNGSHHCLVTEALGPSIGAVIHESKGNRLPGYITRSIASQCVRGLASLHSCGVFHGDLHTGNLLFNMPGLENWTFEEVYQRFGGLDREEIIRIDGQPATPAAPKYAVRPPDPAALIRYCLTETCTVRMVDFGEACLLTAGEPAREINTAVRVASPEVLFKDAAAIGMPTDIWTLACTLYEIFGDHMLLESFMANADEIVVEMVRTLGKLPEPWWQMWGVRSTYFEEDGTFKTTPNASEEPRIVDLKERVAKLVRRTDMTLDMELDEQERLVLVRMLAAMLKYEPSERATAGELVGLLPPKW